ncbi:DNA-directed RNA polymerase subunit alpha C-terminal domain-containing protein [Niastella sp. OAS944]|uniref:DNA-directed RNA polymerase subunit alpha C-terminal domain-containing protein n=1 Tax=Niastella sp. OAS944 TaxID=2664089 RepID=UPI003476F5FA|nr:DNA-directed RNA polymerase alpha subunit [Chitinophagaceae bacterium OAS944]
MNRYDHEIAHLQHTLQHFDLKQCKLIASWLWEHIHTLEADEQLYHTSIKQFQLSTRALNILQYNKITTIGQLLQMSADWDNLKQLKGAGAKVLAELKEKLAQVKAGRTE